MQPQGERIARLEQRQKDFEGDLETLRTDQRADHHRLRNVEDAVSMIVEATKDARRAEARQYRRLALVIQWVGVALAGGMFALAIVTLLTHH